MYEVCTAKTKYNEIHAALREKVEDETCAFQELLPSENILMKEFGYSRNIIHRAIGQLASEGYAQNIHGKGVRTTYRLGQQQSEFILRGMEGLKKTVARSRKNYAIRVVCSAELTVDETICRWTTSPVGAQIYCIQRVRCIEGEALIIGHNYFLKDMV